MAISLGIYPIFRQTYKFALACGLVSTINRRNSRILVLSLLKPKFQALPRAFRCNITTTPESMKCWNSLTWPWFQSRHVMLKVLVWSFTPTWAFQNSEGSHAQKFKTFFLHLGLAAGLLRVDELNLGLISFTGRHLEYNEGIRMAAQSVLGRLPLTFNGLHLRLSHEAAKTWKIVLPDQVVPKLMLLQLCPSPFK